jgi:hypothetical protein
MKCCEYSHWRCIHNTSFSSKLTNGSKKLEGHIAQGWKGLLGTNILAYWTHLQIMNKVKCCEYNPYSPWSHIYNTSFSL